ncbi:MAG: hypothetical protein HZA04_04925 [Nitrospinae bacterium]|nr:hypothetical protein [Nitrospinota bacterium]
MFLKRGIGYSVLVLSMLVIACATTSQNTEGVKSVSRGIAIMVDASTVNQSTIGNDDFPIADNRAVAELTAGTVKTVLESKGMTLAGTPRTSIGARTTGSQYKLINPDGTKTETSESVQPPFAASPELDVNGRKQLNELYRSLVRKHTAPLAPPSPPTSIDPSLLSNVQGDGVLVVICEGRSPSAGSRAAAVGTAFVAVVAAAAGGSSDVKGEIRTQSKAEIYLIRRSNGAVLWHDEEEAHDLTPQFFAESVKRMLEKLPRAN